MACTVPPIFVHARRALHAPTPKYNEWEGVSGGRRRRGLVRARRARHTPGMRGMRRPCRSAHGLSGPGLRSYTHASHRKVFFRPQN
eukprot:1974123-Prymnesium_polylepis.1